MSGKKSKESPLTYYIIRREDGRLEMYHNSVLHSKILSDMKYEILERCECKRAGLEKLRDIIDECYSNNT